MKAELRYGNLIQHGSDYYAVKEIRDYSIEAQHTDGTSEPTTLPYVDIAPIQLTEDWLIKFGFSKRKHPVGENIYQYYKIDGYGFEEILLLNAGGKRFALAIMPTHIEHVHALQNYYFATTLKELTQTHNK